MTPAVENRLEKMQQDLEHALMKPAEERSWVMVIDVDKCIGCHACEVSCKAEHAAPPGVSYRVVFEVEDGDFPDVTRVFMPTNCQQCDNAPCVEGLPKDAYTKRADGILVFHYDKMKGSDLYKSVSDKCPYSAVYHDEGGFFTEDTPRPQDYEKRRTWEADHVWQRDDDKAAPVDAVRKCHFCAHRLDAGMLPACVTTCVGGAMYFGDEKTWGSLVSELPKKREAIKINEEEGTQPRVTYLTGTVTTADTCRLCHE